ncbi:MAG TPA: amidohydrolase family protein [Candidatus Limnocylindrales bacterium]|jgi:predicted TIM-barrel fold metal-dependent hydrolase|nr:amidohydrolase family protein [Candidatus Limnocylindrales bacterium]
MAGNGSDAGFEVIISSDSHVMEPSEIIVERAPKAFKDQVPRFPNLKVGSSFQTHPGGSDPTQRIKEMETDGLSAEVLYPTYLLPQYAMDDARLQEVTFRAYNDWLIEYCNSSPKRLIGIAAIAVYNIDEAVKELERCAKAGMKGSLIWQAPHPDLPLHSEHYNKFWAASQDLNMPVHLHILTGHGYHKTTVFGNKRTGVEAYRGSVNLKLKEVIDDVFELIFYGVLERYPGLKIVSVENEIGWMPFMMQQWDYYYNRFKKVNPPPFTKNPSEYFKTQIYGTFFRDTVAGHNFQWWGQDNCMWSNDYPHGNSTWPESKKYIDRDLGHLPEDIRKKLVYTNVKQLYGIDIPHPSVH